MSTPTEKHRLRDGTEVDAVRVETPSFRRNGWQVYYHAWVGHDRLVRYLGDCVVCHTRCYSHDDGQDDPRGILGHHSGGFERAEEHDKVGPDVLSCAICDNDEPRYRRLMEICHRQWRDKPVIEAPDLTEHKIEIEGFWEAARLVDGYDRMDEAHPYGWRPVSAWGRDGWDLLEWPYYVLYVRKLAGEGPHQYQFATNCEGDVDAYGFPTEAERNAAIDGIALWHWASRGKEWVKGVFPDEVPEHLTGPYSPSRHD